MKVLLIAPYYAPSSEVPSVRMVSLSEYLRSQGHDVTVLCYGKKTLLSMYEEKELSSSVPEGVKIVEFEKKNYKIPFISDILMGKKFKKEVFKLITPSDYDVVLNTCGPYYTLEAMPYFKKRFDVPYILDFRDLGAINYRPKLISETDKSQLWKKVIKALYRNRIKKREGKAVKFAQKIICVSQIDLEKMKSSYSIPDDKINVATNGFDENKLLKINAVEKESTTTGSVFGKFMYYSKERALAILEGISELNQKGYNIKLKHIGRKYDWIEPAISAKGIDPKCYDNCGLKEYSEGMSILGAADFFVVEDTSPDDVGTKIYDYIFWNKPIVAAVPENIPLAKLIKTFKYGYVCENKHDVEKALKEIIDNKYDVLDPELDRMKYSRKYQNQIIENTLYDAARR